VFLIHLHAANAAEFLVNNTVHTTDYGSPGAKQVWTSSTDGYVFYHNSTANIVMASTTDGGVTWSAERQVDSVNTLDAADVAVWWDGWTGDGTTQYIHIATIDTGVDDTYYTRLDLTTGAFSTTVLATTQVASITVGTNYTAITKAENGVIYMAAADISDSWVVSCSTTCTTAGNWSERTSAFGTTPDFGDDPPFLAPIGGTNNIMLVYWDTSADTLDYNVYSATSSSWWFTATKNFATGIEDNTLVEGQLIGFAYDSVRGDIYIASGDDTNDYVTQDHDIIVWKYNIATGWVQLSNPATNVSGGIAGVKIGVNIDTGYLYVAYIRRTTIGTATTANIYYVTSTDGGLSWSGESAALNTTVDSLFFFDATQQIKSSYRFGVTWKYITAPNDDDLYFAPISIWYKVNRRIHLFEGFTLKLPSGRMIVNQE